jgi:hypothetical protein
LISGVRATCCIAVQRDPVAFEQFIAELLISLTGCVYVMPEPSPISVAKHLDEKRAKREITDANSMPALDVGHARVRGRAARVDLR